MTHDVFISYSHYDNPVADTACAALEAAGIRCWIAPRDVVPGSEWGHAIIQAIDEARVLVLVFSSKANLSAQVGREIERAVDKGVTIIPLRLEEVKPERSLEYYLAGIHWLDALTPPLEQHLQRLANAINSFLHALVSDTPNASEQLALLGGTVSPPSSARTGESQSAKRASSALAPQRVAEHLVPETLLQDSAGIAALVREIARIGFGSRDDPHRKIFIDHIDPCFTAMRGIHTDYLANLDAFEAKVTECDALDLAQLHDLVRAYSRTNEAVRREVQAYAKAWANTNTPDFPWRARWFFRKVEGYFGHLAQPQTGTTTYRFLMNFLKDGFGTAERYTTPDEIRQLLLQLIDSLRHAHQQQWEYVAKEYAEVKLHLLR